MARLGWGDLTEPFLFTFNSNCHFLKNLRVHIRLINFHGQRWDNS